MDDARPGSASGSAGGDGALTNKRSQDALSGVIDGRVDEHERLTQALGEIQRHLVRLAEEITDLRAGIARIDLSAQAAELRAELAQLSAQVCERLSDLPSSLEMDTLAASLAAGRRRSEERLQVQLNLVAERIGVPPKSAASVELDSLGQRLDAGRRRSERRLKEHLDAALLTLIEAMSRDRPDPPDVLAVPNPSADERSNASPGEVTHARPELTATRAAQSAAESAGSNSAPRGRHGRPSDEWRSAERTDADEAKSDQVSGPSAVSGSNRLDVDRSTPTGRRDGAFEPSASALRWRRLFGGR